MTLTRIDTRPRRAVAFTPMETNRTTLIDAAAQAEDLGYEAVVVPEGWGLDATVVLAEIAIRTERIRLVTGVLSVWGRSAATLAMTAATLDDLSGGRFTLGLGTSTAALAEQFHGVPFTAPAQKLDTTITDVRALLAGHRTIPAGGGHGLRLGQAARPDIPIWAAALGPRAVAAATRRADAWLPALIPRSRLDAVRSGVAASGRPSCELVTGPFGAATCADVTGRAAVGQLLGW